VILIELPPFGITPLGAIASKNTLAVGFTDEMLEKWDRALGTQTLPDYVDWSTKFGDIIMAASWAAPGDGRSKFDR
jgi:hypothetical protein